MIDFFNPIREFTFTSVLLRLLLALLCGCVIGYGRARRNREAGMRTYMHISLGAALCLLVSLYENEMLNTAWAEVVAEIGLKFDGARFGAMAIAGIGFLGAGMILKGSHQKVSGLNTAAGLLAAVVLSLAVGAGFVECGLTACLLIGLVLNGMAPWEEWLRRRARNMSLVVELDSAEGAAEVIRTVEELGAQIYEVEYEDEGGNASAMFILRRCGRDDSPSRLLSSVAELEGVRSVQELIA